MCMICHRSPCLTGCPNAPEPEAAFYCHSCGGPILPEEEYARIGGVEYCESCIDDMPYCRLIPLLGGEWKTVRKGEKVICSDCKEELREGEEYGVLNGFVLCEGCIDEIPYCELVVWMDREWNAAREDDIYDGYDG